MNIWLLTIGSSDVQLSSNELWSDWYHKIKKSIYRLTFEPVRTSDDEGEPYRLPARVLGITHDQLSEEVRPYLSFPLLQNFIQKLQNEEIQIDQIIVLLSDQENIFPESEREDKRCPYWQDTCQLYSILESYLYTHFPNTTVQPLFLKPKSVQLGLDNWDAVLELVRQEISNLKFKAELQRVYVSHQAGTPAISSAVQFCSLAKFGDRVRFLVSSEYKPELTGFVESSSYLRGIQREQAKKLLENYDYMAIKRLVKLYLNESDKILLNAAIQWNYSEFQEFQKLIQQSDIPCPSEFDWWQVGYEAAYLSIIRLKQGNTVDCIFHSFRAIEGLLRLRVKRFSEVTLSDDATKIILPYSIEVPWSETPVQSVNAYGKGLYYAFLNLADIEDIPNVHNDFKKFGGIVFENRNNMFHNLNGAAGVKAVFKFWGIDPKTNVEVGTRMFEERLLACLNLVSEQEFDSLRKASDMSKVHNEIKKILENLS